MKEKATILLEKDVQLEQKLESAQEKIKSSSDVQVEEKPTQNIVVETPNYDLIPDLPPEKKKRVLSLSKEVEKQQPKPRVARRIAAGLILALTVGVGVYSAVDLSASLAAYNAAQSQYSVNVANLLKNIASVDSGNKTSELLETFPKELSRPDSLKKQSNWFDRFCNFLSGLFGG